MKDYEKTQTTIKLLSTLSKGKKSWEELGCLSIEYIQTALVLKMNSFH